MKQSVTKIASLLIAVDTNREQIIAATIAASIPVTQVKTVDLSSFYFASCWKKVDDLVCDLNELILLSPEKMCVEIRSCWESRIRDSHEPFAEWRKDNVWDTSRLEFTKEELMLCEQVQQAVLAHLNQVG